MIDKARTHVPAALLTRYATAEPDLDDATVWTVEAHLESCPDCRDALAAACGQPLQVLLDDVHAMIDRGIRSGPGPERIRGWRRLAHRWAVWALLPWLAMTTSALVVALLLDRTFPYRPSLVLLLAPVAPLAGMAAAWSRRTDPAWEIIAGTPRAGLELLLRRSLVVLATVIPALAVAGWYVGQSPVRWLLPCLTFTAVALLLGGRIGVPRAAALLTAVWMAAVVAPSIVTARLPFVIQPGSLPGWAVAAVSATALVLLRGGDHRRLGSWR